MRVNSLSISGIRCFSPGATLDFAPGINLLVGPNNSGKSTVIRSVAMWQLGNSFQAQDLASANHAGSVNVLFDEIGNALLPSGVDRDFAQLRAISNVQRTGHVTFQTEPGVPQGVPIFRGQYPNNVIVPFLANRKVAGFDESVREQEHGIVDGTLRTLYARVDGLAADGVPFHEEFVDACMSILGLHFTTSRSGNGKKAGFYVGTKFIPVDQMGSGIPHVLGLLTELCLAEGKIFILEEPENDLHPAALKALLTLMEQSSRKNQFLISTHSHIVVRMLGALPNSKTFRLDPLLVREPGKHRIQSAQSSVTPLRDDSAERRQLLNDLGYSLWDYDLAEGWIVFEESSLQELVRDFLIPRFVPQLMGRVTTISARGASRLQPSYDDIHRLLVFLHTGTPFDKRIWTIADGDPAGIEATTKLRQAFKRVNQNQFIALGRQNFEQYLPDRFKLEIEGITKETDVNRRRRAKSDLYQKLKAWIAQNPAEAESELKVSAADLIQVLNGIRAAIDA